MNKKVTLIAILTFFCYEAMVAWPEYLLWFSLGILVFIIVGSIKKNNTSYSSIATNIIAHATLILTLTLTTHIYEDHLIAVFASIITFLLLEPTQQAKHVEAKGRNETPTQRFFQCSLLILLLVWYNVTNRVIGEITSIILIEIALNALATGIVTFHFQKTFAAEFRRRDAVIYACITSFLIAQATWVTTLWPFTYLTGAITLAAIIFTVWNIIEADMKRIITLKKIAPSIILSLAAMAIAIATTPWNS